MTKRGKTARIVGTEHLVKETLAETLEQLRKSGRWLLRLSNNGLGHNRFKWAPVGQWTEAKDWNPRPTCGGGLHGQGPEGFGYGHCGNRLELCETEPERVVVDGNKVKVRMARIIAINAEAVEALFILSPDFKCALMLGQCDFPLPEKLTSVGGDLYLRGYSHPLPEKLTSVGGYLNLRGYSHPLPEKLTSVGGDLYLEGYSHPLPEKLTSVGGDLYLEGYSHPLPEKLSVKGKVRK
jgi:hypothetical protein